MTLDPTDAEDIVLSELQLDVMRVLWRNGETAVADVAAALAQPRDLAHTTVATLLSRLARRGAVEARRDGRQLFYRARVSESQVRRSMVADLVGRLFRGDPRALLAHLVNEAEAGDSELERIRALLADDAKHKGSTPR